MLFVFLYILRIDCPQKFSIFNYPMLAFIISCLITIRAYNKHKLEPQSCICVYFFGYAPHQQDYLSLDPIINKIYTSRHVLFYEEIFPFATYKTFQPKDDPMFCTFFLLPFLSKSIHACAILLAHTPSHACVILPISQPSHPNFIVLSNHVSSPV